MSHREKLENDLDKVLRSFVSRNKSILTEIIVDSFKFELNDMVKSQIESAIVYYRSQANADVDISLSKRIASVVKNNFGDMLQQEAEKVVHGKINSSEIESKIDDIVDRDLRGFMKTEIRSRIRELISERELKISL